MAKRKTPTKFQDEYLSYRLSWTPDQEQSYVKLSLKDKSYHTHFCMCFFEQVDQYWSSCRHCGAIKPFTPEEQQSDENTPQQT